MGQKRKSNMKKIMTLLAVAGLVFALAPTAQATISRDQNAYDGTANPTHGLANMKITEGYVPGGAGVPDVFDRTGDWTVTTGQDASHGYGSLEVDDGSVLTYSSGANGCVGGQTYGRGTMLVTGPGEVQVTNATSWHMGYGELTIGPGGWVNFADTSALYFRSSTGYINDSGFTGNKISVTGSGSKLTHLGATMNLGMNDSKRTAAPALEAEGILTVADGGLVQVQAMYLSYDAEGGNFSKTYVHMGVGGVLAVFGNKTLGSPFAPGADNLFTGNLGEIRYNPSGDEVTWVNMNGVKPGDIYTLTYADSGGPTVNGQDLSGYTVLTMAGGSTGGGTGGTLIYRK